MRLVRIPALINDAPFHGTGCFSSKKFLKNPDGFNRERGRISVESAYPLKASVNT